MWVLGTSTIYAFELKITNTFSLQTTLEIFQSDTNNNILKVMKVLNNIINI